jgi:ribonuclease P protein component
MLNRKHRFHGYGTLKRIYSRSQSARGGLIGLKYSKSKPDKNYRVAVVVAKKVSKSAVIRNKIRRQIYEAIRLSENTQLGFDYIFTVYGVQVLELTNEELVSLINSLLLKTKE